MNWTQSINVYCERTDAGFLSEPVNAVTNAAFFLAAWLALRAARSAGKLDWTMTLLIGLTFAVGVGSTLWHTFAQRWAGAADVIPILLFILSYFGLSVWRFFGARRAEAVALTIAFFFFAGGLRSAAASTLPPMFSPAFGYLPALVALVACGALLALRRHPAGWWLLAAGAVFVVSLTFRGLDQRVCDVFPLGTHFAWHLLNGVVLGTLLFGWLRHGARPAPVSRPVAAAAAAG
jgi:4-amino-4-deoxy-L-arabinose transferase-like glycosyltransferase